MPKAGVKLPDGRVVVVEYEKGATPAEIKQLAQTKGVEAPRVKGFPVVPPETPGLVKPSAGGYLAQGAKSRAGDILAMAGGTLMPGSGLTGLASRVVGSEVGQDIGDIATGQKVTPGWGAGTQLVGEGVGRVIGPLLSPATYKTFANRTSKALTAKLDELVPSWRDLSLYERAHGVGQRVLSKNFDGAVNAIKEKIPETFIVRVPEILETEGRRELTDAPRNARMLIDELPELRKAGGKSYRWALKALADQLPDGLSPELDAARAEYKNGAGWIEFAEKGKFMYDKKFDPVKAQQALDKFGKKTLLGRGLDDIRTIIEGPKAERIEPVKHNPFLQRLEGGLVGGAAGLPFGIPHGIGGAIGGVVAGGGLPRVTYRNVPTSPATEFAGRMGKAAVGESVREAGRDLGIKEQMPGGVLPAGADPSGAFP